MEAVVAAYQVLKYDPARHPLRRAVELACCADALESLELPQAQRLTRRTDQSLPWHGLFYANFKSLVEPAYLELVHQVIRPWFEEPIVYQAVPTFRVHLTQNVAVGEFHRDRDYGHARHELNFWLPLTDAWASNSVWVEDLNTFTAVTCRPGQIAVFDGANRLHGNLPNLTGQTRVSFDFRAYPRRLHQDREEKSVNGRREFKLGSYWAELG